MVRQPHPQGPVAEAMAKVSDAPGDLGLFVATGGQGEDGVVVGLGEGVAYAVGSAVARPNGVWHIGLDDAW